MNRKTNNHLPLWSLIGIVVGVIVALCLLGAVLSPDPEGEPDTAATSTPTPGKSSVSPSPSQSPDPDPRFDTCREANNNGYGPYSDGDPEYKWYDDRDGDGAVCEPPSDGGPDIDVPGGDDNGESRLCRRKWWC